MTAIAAGQPAARSAIVPVTRLADVGPKQNHPGLAIVRATKKAGAKTHRPSSSSPFSPVPVHPWSKASGDAAIASGRGFPALISNADDNYMGGHCVQNKMSATMSAPSPCWHVDDAAKAATKRASSEGGHRRKRGCASFPSRERLTFGLGKSVRVV